jgi:predicted metal-binding membrane protein
VPDFPGISIGSTAPAAPLTRFLPRRDRIAILASLFGITQLAWAYLVVMALSMDEMSMTTSGMMRIRPWGGLDFLLMFLMWAVMMVGMMAPTAAPMTLIYAAVARKAAAQATPLAPTAVFVAGYIVMWSLFSVAATLTQWGLDQAALLSPMMVSNSSALGAGLLIAAGIYQWTPFKDACLQHCRSPAHFFAQHWRSGAAGAFRLGLEHGAYCLGCCWVLMGLLFLGGVMNLLWIAAITFFVVLEKLSPWGVQGGRVVGGVMVLTGIVALMGFLDFGSTF